MICGPTVLHITIQPLLFSRLSRRVVPAVNASETPGHPSFLVLVWGNLLQELGFIRFLLA